MFSSFSNHFFISISAVPRIRQFLICVRALSKVRKAYKNHLSNFLPHHQKSTHQILITKPLTMGGEDLRSYAILSFICILSIYITSALFFKSRTRFRLPPSPFALPIIGHLYLLAPIPHQALYKLSQRCGPLIHLRLGSVPCVVACSAETAKEFLKTHELAFSDRPQSKAVSYLTYGSADFSFAPYGPYWKFMKKLCMSELLGGRTLEQLRPVRRGEILRLLQAVNKKSKERKAVDMSLELIRLTNNVISRMTMSRRCSGSDGEAEEARKVVEETSELAGKFNLADYIGFCKNLDLQGFDKRLEDVRRRFDGMMERIMTEKEEARKEMGNEDRAKDLLDILLDISEDETAEVRLSRENIKAFILVSLFECLASFALIGFCWGGCVNASSAWAVDLQ